MVNRHRSSFFPVSSHTHRAAFNSGLNLRWLMMDPEPSPGYGLGLGLGVGGHGVGLVRVRIPVLGPLMQMAMQRADLHEHFAKQK